MDKSGIDSSGHTVLRTGNPWSDTGGDKDGILSIFHTRDPTLRHCPLWTSATRHHNFR